MSKQHGTLQILTGEAMWPDRVNARWPGAEFVARARFDRGGAVLPTAFETLDAPATWGVLVALPDQSTSGTLLPVTTDLGEALTANFDSAELLAGNPEGVVAAARYWELPWRYVAALRAAVASAGVEVLDEEPRDDAVIAPNDSSQAS